MASIEVIIRDDQGKIISEGNVKEIALRHANLETIEAGVKAWRKQVYLKLRHNFYNRRRGSSPGEKNELGLCCNGTRTVTLKTWHGKFEFKLQKYDLDGLGVSFLELC
ncbi:MAG: hypothetical protein KME05_20735 [Gloeocapsa sp. UFS-A4-WI-NPMV-4B04]|jgi:hypothetical protein|nr:hypothetical protein [Gloeocapsa sp. UFS-A4-WI-NPMV-4B04]